MPRGIPAGRGAAGARGTPRRGAVGAAPRRGMPRGLATRDMRGLASLVIFLTNLLIGFLLALAADQPPPPLSFARRPRHNRPPWSGPFFLRRDKSSLPIASVYCHSEPPARLRRRLWCWCWCWCRGCRGLLLQPPPCLLDRDDVGRPEPPVAAMPRDTQAHTLLLREHQLPPEGIRVSDTTLICTQDHSSITHFLDSRFFKRESFRESI